MRKVVRLTESDLIRIVKRVIKEETTEYNDKEIESLDKFLSYINPNGKNGSWKQERTDFSLVVKLPPNAKITNLGGFDIKKHLYWVFYDRNKKVDSTEFMIYKSQGVLYWKCTDTKTVSQKNEKLIGNEESAYRTFNKIVGSSYF